MLPTLQIGPLALHTPGLILLLGVWIGLSLAERLSTHDHDGDTPVDVNTLYHLALVALAAGLTGARLSYIIQYPSAFKESPLSAISLNPGLLDVWGGLVAACVACLLYGSRKNLHFWPVLDACTPAFAVFAVSLGLSHFASGEAYGAPADLPWSVELWGAHRHPAQVYETLAASLILWTIWPKKAGSFHPGWRFLAFAALSAGARLFLEAFRGDSFLLSGGLRAAQVAAWCILAGSLIGLLKISSLPLPREKKGLGL
jgi:prolipoprotein diacylglyceryltransferase